MQREVQHAASPAGRDDSIVLLRARIDAWLADYVDCLDGKRIESWPDFFEEECLYTIVAAENAALDLELALIRCESRGMLKDRAYAIQKTALFGPRDVRHFFTGLVIRDASPDLVRAECNFLIVETLNDVLPRVFAVGRSYDEIKPVGDGFRFKTRRCVYTSNLIANSLVVPI
jgi:3-phenylpropionate/cinnamic acid dioxygenase small subunit